MVNRTRVVWIANQPTPQFTPILNFLADQCDVSAVFHADGSGGRGWGDLNIQHEHRYLDSKQSGSVLAGIRFISSHRPDVLVAFGYSARFSMGALLAARLLRIPVVTQSDSDWERERRKPALFRWAKKVFLRTLYSSARTTAVAISASNKSYWHAYGLRHFANIPFESPIPAPSADRLPGSFDVDLPERYVLFVGRLIALKRPMDTVEAVAKAREQVPELELVLVGEGDALPGDLPTWVHCVGSRTQAELGHFYAQADALLITSSQEAYGLVVREAMQFGTPALGYRNIPALQELCPYGWNQVEYGDTTALADAVVKAIHEGRWPQLRAINTAPKYSELINSVAASARRGGGE